MECAEARFGPKRIKKRGHIQVREKEGARVSGALEPIERGLGVAKSRMNESHGLRRSTLGCIAGCQIGLDPIFPPESLVQLAHDLPCARSVFLDCNHEIPSERPNELAHLIEAFVAGLGTGSATHAQR